jgi:hypothetical protein
MSTADASVLRRHLKMPKLPNRASNDGLQDGFFQAWLTHYWTLLAGRQVWILVWTFQTSRPYCLVSSTLSQIVDWEKGWITGDGAVVTETPGTKTSRSVGV